MYTVRINVNRLLTLRSKAHHPSVPSRSVGTNKSNGSQQIMWFDQAKMLVVSLMFKFDVNYEENIIGVNDE